MALLISKDPIFEKFAKHLSSLGNTVKPITDKKLDFEFDYKDAELIHGIDGIGGAGALTVEKSPIDYFHIVKKQEWAKCDFAVGGRACRSPLRNRVGLHATRPFPWPIAQVADRR